MVSATGSIHFSLGKTQTRRANCAGTVIKSHIHRADLRYVPRYIEREAHQERATRGLILEEGAKVRGEVSRKRFNRCAATVEKRERHRAHGIGVVEAGNDDVERVGAAGSAGRGDE